MIEIAGYQINSLIYESSLSVVYRGYRHDDQQPVILKILKLNYPTPEEIVRYKLEYEICNRLRDIEGVITAYGFTKYKQFRYITFEDFGGESIRNLNASRRFKLTEILAIAAQVAGILIEIHAANVIHKDINPTNIVFNPRTEQVKIIDFGISNILSRENPHLLNPSLLEGTLAYISPEQTGRMNRPLDYRSDLYSFGVTLYELLCNRLPFISQDPSEIVHCHIAKLSIPPHQFDPEIPLVVSDIVMKLLAKNAEERYQSALGLKEDLILCKKLLDDCGVINGFPLGKYDVSDKFQISQRLYGREEDIWLLLAIFECVSIGRSEVMIVKGEAGIGKSVLVSEIHKPIAQKRGYFISGKFDQFQRNIPYSAFVGAFRELVKQLLTESERQLHRWRESLLAALGENGQIIIDIIPEMELIIGKQPSVLELSYAEAQNRFNMVFQNFVRVFTRPSHPLVLFLDDIQWADAASLQLLQLLITSDESRFLFFIGAYRSNEVDAVHPLTFTLNHIAAHGTPLNEVELLPLNRSDVYSLVADTLKSDRLAIVPLAELVIQKTNGNPFFINEFLKSLYEEGLINFDLEKGAWKWDLIQIQEAGFTDNVIDLMLGKIQKLSANSQKALQIAACIGNYFDSRTLASAADREHRLVTQDLLPVLSEGLISPLTNNYQFFSVDDDHDLTENFVVEYKFLHDRVQQAAYALIPESDKQVTHLKIGRQLHKKAKEDAKKDAKKDEVGHRNAIEEKAFRIANHLNMGLSLITDNIERLELAELNLLAGKKAKDSNAYANAQKYLATGIGLLPTQSWENHYQLTLSLYHNATEATYLNADYDECHRLVDRITENAQHILDTIASYKIKLEAYTSQQKFHEVAIATSYILMRLGESFPANPNELQVGLEVLLTEFNARRKRIDNWLNLPTMTDPYKLAVVDIVTTIAAATINLNPLLIGMVILRVVNLTIQYGISPNGVIHGPAYGLIRWIVFQDIEGSYRVGLESLQLIDKHNIRRGAALTICTFEACLRHWKEHLRESMPSLQKAIQLGIEVGEYSATGLSVLSYCLHRFYMGDSLTSVIQAFQDYRIFLIQKINQSYIVEHMQAVHQLCLNLAGLSEHTTFLIGEAFNEIELLPTFLENKNGIPIYYTYTAKGMSHYLFEDYKTAIDAFQKAIPYALSVVSAYPVTNHNMYQSLACLGLCWHLPKQARRNYLRQVARNQKKMRRWAEYCPVNFQHKYDLVEAERMALGGQHLKAMEYYDRAIIGARNNEYIQEEALANELAGKFYLQIHKNKVAKTYFLDAISCYQSWGATAKVKHLETNYLKPESNSFSSIKPKIAFLSDLSTPRDTDGLRITTNKLMRLDLASVVKTFQVLSDEIDLAKLLAKLMKLLIENAGAQVGYLILENEGSFEIEAFGNAENNQIEVLQSQTMDKVVPTSVINYVMRTLESIVMGNATQEGLFTSDHYIQSKQIKSVLCIPLLNQGELSGILYMENALVADAFTTDRLEVLTLLSSQAAISINNARLYTNLKRFNENLEQLVSDRTQELSQALKNLQATQNELVASEKMAALGKLVAGVAHEINTPIGIGVTASSLIFDKIQEMTTAFRNGTMKRSDLEKFMDTVQQSSAIVLSNLNRAVELIQSFKQVAVDQSSETRRSFKIKEYLEEILLNLQPKLKRTKIKVHIHCEDNIILDSYPGMISQIVTNLAD